ncbi:MAG: ABC transporter permease [Spirochaetota bacterium]|nr:ABC transporter permease [Spirochaetota bacterium]
MNATIKNMISGAAKHSIFILCSVLLLFSILAITVDHFFTAYNIFNIITQASIYGTMAIGLTFVLISGGIDVSLPAVMASGAVVGVTYMANTGNGFIGCLIVLGVCLIFGLINGVAVAYFNMPPLIVTLATSTISTGFSVWYSNYLTITGIPVGITSFFRSYILGVPAYVLVFFLIIACSQFLLTKTVYGRWLYFVGLNQHTSEVTEVPTRKTIATAYLISAFTAGLAGIMLATQIGSAQAGMGRFSMVLDIVSSAVIGGVSIYGGRGEVMGAAFGALFIALLSNVMNLLGIQFYSTLMLKGSIIILATAFDYVRNR